MASSSQAYTRASITDNLAQGGGGAGGNKSTNTCARLVSSLFLSPALAAAIPNFSRSALSFECVLHLESRSEELRVVSEACAHLSRAVTEQTDLVKQSRLSLGSQLIIFSLLPVRDAQ